MTAAEFAKKNGFDTVKEIDPWNGCKCREAVFSHDEKEIVCTGYPHIILEKNGRFRFAGYDEAMKYLDEAT